MEPFTNTNFYGLGQAVDATLDDSVHQAVRKRTPELLDDEIYPRILGAQLDRAGIGLAVVDEVHNWKSGRTNGAANFRTLWAPHIHRKLLMSATPFQIHEDELRNVFTVASGLKRKGQCCDPDDLSMRQVEVAMKAPAKEALVASRRFEQAWQGLSLEHVHALETDLANDVPAQAGGESLQTRLKLFLQK